MPTENTTPNRGYQLPFGSNELADDVLRLISAYSAIDLDVAGLLVSVAQRALLIHSHVIGDTTGLQAALDSKQDESEKGNANGYASLGADGKVPSAQLPSALFGALSYQGDWNANTNTPTIPAAAPANKGWYYMASVAGATNVSGYTDWKVGDWAVSDGTKWTKIDNTDAVASVAGLVGTISAASLKTALAIAVADITDASANGRSLIAAANYAAMKTLLAITATDIVSGTLADARLPTRLGLVCQTVADWNAATANGWYMAAGALNAPTADWFFGQTITHIESLWLQQDLYGFTTNVENGDSKHYRRYRKSGIWGAWFRVYENGGELDARYALLGSGPPNAVLEDQKASGTAGGSATAGSWQTRDLNTEIRDPSGLISIASNAFTPTVAGWVEWSAPAWAVANHQTRLFNVTDGVVVAYGSSERAGFGSDGVTRSTGGAPVAANKAYRIEHQVISSRATTGYGFNNGFGTEVYSRVNFWRI
ncbi:pyocin knob domain-containing protein [Mesorhizobium sp.]|uniref:pyocin knob domain-containing protein n=1 Tax=Mesorhizobium sp. TaxID=1871066 RepID=UPI000FE61978|nr:pyocin knob domain-containing protein [Mesorhizobium sp.]RWM29400.1 MAG: hypothetical protein EOR74_06900 [Mesorhizobium sp.]